MTVLHSHNCEPCALIRLACLLRSLPRIFATGVVLSTAALGEPCHADELVVGSKRFTESYILGEIVAQTAAATGASVVHRPGMGNTAILFEALKAGGIDVYPDYTGTIARQLLNTDATDLDTLNRGLNEFGLGVGVPLGFNNTYALAMRHAQAQRLGVTDLSDLASHPQLRFGLSHEFLKRNDGWSGLKRRYALPQTPVGIDHGLAYEAIAAGQLDVMDIYSTDAKIARFDLRVLDDDRNYFPKYDAVLVYRLDLPQRFPQAWRAITGLQSKIDEQQMIALNARAELDNESFSRIAHDFLGDAHTSGATVNDFRDKLFGPDFWHLTRQHLLLVFASLAAAVAVAIPLGMWAARNEAAGQVILSVVGIIQTIPALALLVFLIPLLGRIGTIPALVALFLYSLLPVVRNTHSGLTGIDLSLRESAQALGLPAAARLRLIELPFLSLIFPFS